MRVLPRESAGGETRGEAGRRGETSTGCKACSRAAKHARTVDAYIGGHTYKENRYIITLELISALVKPFEYNLRCEFCCLLSDHQTVIYPGNFH